MTKLGLRNASHLVQIQQGDEWKIIGLINVPAVFQALVSNVLRDTFNQFLYVYNDGILMFSKTQEESIQHVLLVLQRLLENKLYVKAEKYEIHVTSVNFLGFIIQQGQLSLCWSGHNIPIPVVSLWWRLMLWMLEAPSSSIEIPHTRNSIPALSLPAG